MAQRQSTFRVSSEEVQGEDSYVVFHHMSFGTVLEAMKKGGDEKADGKTSADEEKKFTEKLLQDAVVEWNWVDDNGEPLPLPSKGLEIESLLTGELMWLVDQVTGRAQAKNSS
jgi:hypothetical protein